MTYAPKRLRSLEAFWKSNGGVPLGIVGNARHTVGYHLGRDRIYDGPGPGLGNQDYSVVMARDKAGLTDAASAIDLGKLDGSLTNLYIFSNWLVMQCTNAAPGYKDVREIIYSPDGQKVQRWSGVDGEIHTGQGNGDSSHIGHTHISYYRDSENRDKVGLFAPYFVEADMPGLAVEILESVKGTVTVNPGLVGVKIVQMADREMFDAPTTARPVYARAKSVDPNFYPGKELYLVGQEAAVVLAEQFTFKAEPTTGGGDILRPVELVVSGKAVWKGNV